MLAKTNSSTPLTDPYVQLCIISVLKRITNYPVLNSLTICPLSTAVRLGEIRVDNDNSNGVDKERVNFYNSDIFLYKLWRQNVFLNLK